MNVRTLFGKKWIFKDFNPGESQDFLEGLNLKDRVFQGKSPFQEIDIVDTNGSGRVLFLSGLMQVATLHEYVYHEMLVHPALCVHKNPERVLIVGGGDGGTLREVLKHNVKEAWMVEIDKMVVDVSKKYLRAICKDSFQDPRTKLVFGDGAAFVKQYKNYFDCIIVDTNDPDEYMSEHLFTPSFFKDSKRALRKGGILSMQTGYISEHFGVDVRKKIKKAFTYFQLHRAHVKMFPLDEHSFSFASDAFSLGKIPQSVIQKTYKERKLKTLYYSPAMHRASTVFPPSLL